ncbi:hypothetical protein Tco_0615223 [Tanacetum coccineum]
MNSLEKSNIARGDLLNALNEATSLSQDKHLVEWAKSSTSIAWNLGPRMTAIEKSQAAIRTEVSLLSKTLQISNL